MTLVQHGNQKRTRTAAIIPILAVVANLWSVAASAQEENAGAAEVETRVAWIHIVDGVRSEWPLDNLTSLTGIYETASDLLVWHQSDGYYHAAIDSLHVEDALAGQPAQATIYVTRHARSELGRVTITGMTQFSERQLLDPMATRSGTVLNKDVLEEDLAQILSRYEERGFVLTKVQIARLAPNDHGQIDVVIHVEEGPLLELAGIEITGGTRTKPSFVARVTGLKVGQPLKGYDPVELAAELESTGLFRRVDSVRIAVDTDQNTILKVALVEEAPGAFDALLGYLPSAGPDGGGSVVGNVNILLRHVLGGGRSFDFKFNKNPGSVTRVSVAGEDPFIFGSPLRLAVRFDGFQQDSTYDSRGYGIEGGLRAGQHIELFANLTRELTRPGSVGAGNVPRSDSWFAGFGFSYRQLDRRSSPRRGVEFVSNLENGRKEREIRITTGENAGDRVIETNFQQRLHVRGRAYMPLGVRSVGVLGVDTRGVQSRSYDDADLVRFGGANSMRGYNEEQFRGNLAGRLLTEWRYLLDRSSYFFAFFDLGYVSIPELNTTSKAAVLNQELLTGYGVGLQLWTEAGLFTISLGFNPDDGLEAKVHVGMTLGL